MVWQNWQWAALISLALLTFWLGNELLDLNIWAGTASFEQVYDIRNDTQAWKDYLVDSDDSEPKKVLASITGAVNSPGLYEFQEGAVVADLLNKAKGLKSSADKAYVSQEINLAQVITSGQQIYVPFIEEQKLFAAETKSDSQNDNNNSTQQIININTATASELETLPGVGPSTAQKIIAARPFSSKKDLLEVAGIGESTLAKLEDLIQV